VVCAAEGVSDELCSVTFQPVIFLIRLVTAFNASTQRRPVVDAEVLLSDRGNALVQGGETRVAQYR